MSVSAEVYTLIFLMLKIEVALGNRKSDTSFMYALKGVCKCAVFQNVLFDVYCLTLLIMVHRSIKCFEHVSLGCLFIIHCFLYSKWVAMFHSAKDDASPLLSFSSHQLLSDTVLVIIC